MMNEDRSQQIEGTVSRAASSLLENIRPLAVFGIRGVLEISDKTKSLYAYAREEIEDLVAEAQFERMKGHVDEEIFNDEAKD